MPRSYAPFGEQLANALREQQVSQRELAKRLAAADGTKPESKRRWLGKILSGDVEPGDASVAGIEQALELDGYLRRPPVRAAMGRRDRLAALEEQVGRLRAESDSALQAVVVRLAEIEAALATAGLRPAPRKSARRRQQ